MATKPTFYPRLNHDNPLVEAAVASALRNGGYAVDALLASGEYNELLNEVDAWIEWLDSISIASEHGTFKGRLYRNGGAPTPVDITLGYTICGGLATIWWDNIARTDWHMQRFLLFDSATPTMPPQLRPMVTSTDPIVGSAMYLAHEAETSPPSGALATTHIAAVRVYGSTGAITQYGETVSGCQIEFFKENGLDSVSPQPWNDQISNTILAGSVTYQTGYLTY